jgi:hypothetical protein
MTDSPRYMVEGVPCRLLISIDCPRRNIGSELTEEMSLYVRNKQRNVCLLQVKFLFCMQLKSLSLTYLNR